MSSDEENDDLCVRGYESRLFPQDSVKFRSDQDLLIPWNDDEELLIDRYEDQRASDRFGLRNDGLAIKTLSKHKFYSTIRKSLGYDCRLYLLDLSSKTIGEAGKLAEEEYDKVEEELCEQERYKDLEKRIKEDEREERRKRAEIAFNYAEENNNSEDELEESDDEEANQPYQSPEGIKMPTGLVLPETQKHGHLIERTANFVVQNGPQMEVIIKAKHSRDQNQSFDFLNFDNILFSFYKFMCKLIREKKYTPAPPKHQPKPGESFVHQKPENYVKEEEESDSDSDGDYLHPLLAGGSSVDKKTEKSPIKLPPLPSSLNKNGNDNPYSSLYAIHAVKPPEPPPEPKPEPSTSEPQFSYETDPTEIHNYNTWHQNFFQRPTPNCPNPPLVPVRPDQETWEQIDLAARYVAANGAFAENRLLEQNRSKLTFLYPDNPYNIVYHTRIRQCQYKLNPYASPFVRSKYFEALESPTEASGNDNYGQQNVTTAHVQQDYGNVNRHGQYEGSSNGPTSTYRGEPYNQGYQNLNSSLRNDVSNQNYTENTIGSGVKNNSIDFSSKNGFSSTIPKAPEPPETREWPTDEAEVIADEKVKQIRREKARQFMADLLKRKRENKEERPVDKVENVKDALEGGRDVKEGLEAEKGGRKGLEIEKSVKEVFANDDDEEEEGQIGEEGLNNEVEAMKSGCKAKNYDVEDQTQEDNDRTSSLIPAEKVLPSLITNLVKNQVEQLVLTEKPEGLEDVDQEVHVEEEARGEDQEAHLLTGAQEGQDLTVYGTIRDLAVVQGTIRDLVAGPGTMRGLVAVPGTTEGEEVDMKNDPEAHRQKMTTIRKEENTGREATAHAGDEQYLQRESRD